MEFLKKFYFHYSTLYKCSGKAIDLKEIAHLLQIESNLRENVVIRSILLISKNLFLGMIWIDHQKATNMD